MKRLQRTLILLTVPVVLLAGCQSLPGERPAATVSDPAKVSDVTSGEISAKRSPAVSGQPETAETEDTKTGTAPAGSDDRRIIWIGDSLTQGSLGEENDNLSGAPYEKLKKLVKLPVDGYGLYGYTTHEALAEYRETAVNPIDPNDIYVIWLGSNDWCTPFDEDINADTKPVIDEIDAFLRDIGPVSDYIIIGTTSRHRLKDLYIPINEDLEAHYKEHYMDVIGLINRYGYSPDNTHLSQQAYDATALGVFEKLKELGYISKEDEAGASKGQPIVWLGDSLTQGSLGHMDDNLDNAPYERLKTLVDVPVEGHGMYGARTHDVLWVYVDKTQLNQIADPTKTYIFWLGSNDWVNDDGVNPDTGPVIDEIDRFLHLEGSIDNYIVIGTTSRPGLEELCHDINRDLEEHYGSHYLDVLDIIEKYGYSPDKTHLSQESYDAVADAVYEKLKELGYI